jgi:hypothetical protein
MVGFVFLWKFSRAGDGLCIKHFKPYRVCLGLFAIPHTSPCSTREVSSTVTTKNGGICLPVEVFGSLLINSKEYVPRVEQGMRYRKKTKANSIWLEMFYAQSITRPGETSTGRQIPPFFVVTVELTLFFCQLA